MKTLVPCDVCSFVAQSHTPCNCCVRFATTVASGHATLATKRTLLLTWAGLHFHRLDRTSFAWRSRVEDRRGGLGHVATLRFLSSLIKPDVPISGIRLSDQLHRKAHGGG